MQYTDMTDEQLEQVRLDVISEQERRQRRDMIPLQIADLAQQYRDAGGEQETLETAVTPDE